MKTKNFEEFENINEALPVGMWSDDNKKAIKSWSNDKKSDIEYHITTEEPLSITTTDDIKKAKVLQVLYEHDIKFELTEKKIS